MEAKQLSIGLFGFGTIGAGVVNTLNVNADIIAAKTGVRIVMKQIVDIDTETDRGVELGTAKLGTDASSIIDDDSITIVIELIGGSGIAKEIVEKCLSAGKHVVTANKELIAKHGPELDALARENGVHLLFEASVGGGIPILTPLLSCLRANRIDRVLGIVNGTTNFILSEMESGGASFDDILKKAQELGYAEADPTNDIEGFDAAYKASILSAVSFGKHVDATGFPREGITGISREEMDFARELGYTIKLLAVLEDKPEGADVRVHPTLLPKSHPLSSIHGVMNAVYLEGEPIGPLMFVGRGAGPDATSSAVIGDVIEIATRNPGEDDYSPRIFNKAAVASIDNVENKFYLRIQVEDRAGVLSELGSSLGKNNVSLEQVVQKALKENKAELVLLTHLTREADMKSALKDIRALDCVFKVISVLRVFE
ncbi:MAG TPA: homoserine dehydrogenase [bacterium]|nr:homoserine dehydrogenase [bacterium]